MPEKKKELKSVFLEKIEFKDNFGPFKKGTEIEFNDGMKDIIKFYLESKEGFDSTKAEDVAKRMKINVIVGENGTGKSKLFEGLVKGDEILEGYIKNFSRENILIDDFFFYSQFNYFGEKSEYKSINNYLFWADRKNSDTNKFNTFIGYFYKIYSDSNYKKILSTLASSFLHIKTLEIKFYFDINKGPLSRVEDMYFRNIFTQNYLGKKNNLYNKLIKEVSKEIFEKEIFEISNKNKKKLLEVVINNKNKKNYEIANEILKTILTELGYGVKIVSYVNKLRRIDIDFGNGKKFNQMSSGEKIIFIRFINIIGNILEKYKKGQKEFLILIDEPDLHLHLDWQRQYIQNLIDVFGNLLKDITDINLHFIIATHSSFLLSDVPAENVILLKKGDDGFTKVIKWEDLEGNNTKNTFGANFVDLIRTGFFFSNKNLMGSFAENIIGDIAQKRREEITIGKEIKNKKEIEKIEDQIGDSFLKDNLLYFKKKDAENGDRGDN